MSTVPQEILVIRRDNIGDLICTTPVFRALRERFPEARISVLANTYNAPVLAGNPDIDTIFAYEKAKHRQPGTTILGWLLRRLSLLRFMRRKKFDYVILAATGYQKSALRFARLTAGRQVVGFANVEDARGIDLPVSAPAPGDAHEVEAAFRVLSPLGIQGVPPALRLVPSLSEAERLRRQFLGNAPQPPSAIGIHISARKVRQRWPIDKFAELTRRVLEEDAVRVLLFWAPGRSDDVLHPGDDENARELMNRLGGLPVIPVATQRLEELIAGLSLCDRLICSDGGAMHIAAALGKPILCFFGNSNAARWHPWGVPYEMLQTESRDVNDISVEQALAGYRRLTAKIGRPN